MLILIEPVSPACNVNFDIPMSSSGDSHLKVESLLITLSNLYDDIKYISTLRFFQKQKTKYFP